MRLAVGKLPPNLKRRPFAYCAYTDKDQQLLRACIQATGNYAYTTSGSASLTLGSGSVPEGLGIRGKQPIQVFYAENLESTLNVAYEHLAK
ncbi:MAG: hypothetical protein PHE17_21145 [Thiothrix sp.]|uniref:hypothetical protein n=1 Tax=Thiothrix sp. TaxID=1032 RepID=UPI0026129813|nr:hypothetical protein [Thiothrix sp.]MDD5395537.1 hypothetical protein [Thiothrix sp.]